MNKHHIVAKLLVHIKQIIKACTSSGVTHRKDATRRLMHVMSDVSSAISVLTGEPENTYQLRQYEEQLKKELSETRSSLLTLELSESDGLTVQVASLEKDVFDSSVEIKRALSSSGLPSAGSSLTASDSKGVKLPKLDVPTIDGNILNCNFVSLYTTAPVSQTPKS